MTATAAIPEPTPEPTELEEIVERLVARVLKTGESITIIVDRYLIRGRSHWMEQTLQELTRVGLQRLVTSGLHDHNAGRGAGTKASHMRDTQSGVVPLARTLQPGAPHPKQSPPVLHTMADIQLAIRDGSRITVDKGTIADFEYWEQRFSAQKEGLAVREHACTAAKTALRTHRVSCPRKLPKEVRTTLDRVFLNAWRKGVGA